jgi:hypothetical protein
VKKVNVVMPGLVPGIHVFLQGKAWMAGTKAGHDDGGTGRPASNDRGPILFRRLSRSYPTNVMAGLVPAIHGFLLFRERRLACQRA